MNSKLWISNDLFNKEAGGSAFRLAREGQGANKKYPDLMVKPYAMAKKYPHRNQCLAPFAWKRLPPTICKFTRILESLNPRILIIDRPFASSSPSEEWSHMLPLSNAHLTTFRNRALIATITVLKDMSTAPIAGERTTPYE